MIIQNCNPLLVVISKIETLITQAKNNNPDLNDEQIFEIIKDKFSRENIS